MKIVINPLYKEFQTFIATLPEVFEQEGEIIFQGRNVLKRFQIKGISFIVKRFKRPNWINRFIYVSFRSSKATRSYLNGLRLVEFGINTPYPVAYIEEYYWGLSYSYYITLEEKGMKEIRCFCSGFGNGEPVGVLEAFGKFTADMHKKGVLHKDYSPGNILFAYRNGEIYFSLVDINRMKFGVISEEEGYKSLNRLWFDDNGYKRVALAYAKEAGYNMEHAWERIRFYKDKFMN